MKNNKITVIASLLALAFSANAYANPNNQNNNQKRGEEFKRGQILVAPQIGLSSAEFDKIVSGKQKRKLGKSNLHVVEVTPGSEAQTIEKLRGNPHIKYAELDKKVYLNFIPNDSYFGSSYHLGKVGATNAWDTTQGEGITIAILDSGVNSGHQDLAPNMVPGYNSYDNNTNTADVCGHGTAVAGTSSAVTNNGVGVSGIAGKSKIMPVRIAYNDPTNGCYGYYSTITNGLTWAADNGAKIANVSYGGVVGSASIINAANYFRSKGGLVFVSAGNTSSIDNVAPTSSMVVVSATDQNDNKTSWSTYGNAVTLSAPGANIYTTTNAGGYSGWNGTSFSSPLAAGVGALVMAANPKLTNNEVENILYTTAVDLGTAGRDQYFGHGRVNADAAVKAAVARIIPSPDTTAPVVAITSPIASSTVSGIVPILLNATDNKGVAKVDLYVNGTKFGSDTDAPFGFSWDSTTVANGMVNFSAIAYDAAGNNSSAPTVSFNVANAIKQPETTTWIKCANEWETCNFSGTKQVRYGANNSYAYKTVTGPVACHNDVFGDPAYGLTKTCEYAQITVTPAPTPAPVPAPTPSPTPMPSYTNCAVEGATCSFTGTRQVRYGANGSYTYKTATGSISCTNGVFGDPIPGIVKSCGYAESSTPEPVIETWANCATEGGACNFSGTRSVRYGANNNYAYKTATGSISCNNAVFGDPVYGIAKSCQYSSITK